MTSDSITAIASTVLDDVKDYVGVTWSDETTEKNITHDIESGIRELVNIGGEDLDFTTNADGSRALLFDYVRYARSGSIEEFRNNYRESLVNLALAYRVSKLESDEEDEDDS